MKILKPFFITVLIILGTFMAFHYFLTGSFTPKSEIETLKNPLQVQKITKTSIILENGESVKIKYISEIPVGLKVLNDAVNKGVEIDEEGNVFGLLKIHHWCGNDPIRYHLAKIQLSSLILASGEVHPSERPKVLSFLSLDNKLRYTEHGLSISDLVKIYQITNYLKSIKPKENKQ